MLKNRFYQFNDPSNNNNNNDIYSETSITNLKLINELLLNKFDTMEYIFDQIMNTTDNTVEDGSGNAPSKTKVKKKQFSLTDFEKQFVLYLQNLKCNDNSNNNKYFEESLCFRNILFQIGLFWQLSDDMVIVASENDKNRMDLLEIRINKYYNFGLLDVCIINDAIQTLFHIATACDNGEVFDILLQCDNDCQKFKDIFYKVKSCT